MSSYRTPEQRALEAEHQLDQLAHKLARLARQRENLEALIHKLAWIAVMEAIALVLLVYRLVAGGMS